MSNRQTMGAAFVGGLVGSNRSLQRFIGRFAWHLLCSVLMAPLVLLMWLHVEVQLAVRLTVAFWAAVLGLLLVRFVTRKLAPWVMQATAGRSVWRPRMFQPGRSTEVYWLFDSAGTLLYVGIAYDFDQRMRQHANDPAEAHWWWRVDQSRWVHHVFASREEAKAVESDYIKGRRDLPRPLFNRAENTSPA